METRNPMEIPPGKCRRAKSAALRYTSETGKMMAEGENRVNAQRKKTLTRTAAQGDKIGSYG
jgi:hypothetical protein